MATVKRNDNYVRSLPMTSILRLFNVMRTGDGIDFLNIFRGYALSSEIENAPEVFDIYTVVVGDYLDDISFKMYETPHFWWIVAIVNGFTNPYEALEEGDMIKVLKSEHIHTLIDDISDIVEI